ncbi:MAG: hypothetical protein NT161_01440 [Candidatus Nomurabacteria bacterium]|nr:hypothetical protein [Candidatus Nomurabacteria bacterium]
MEQLNIQKLIDGISPLYNSYKQTSRNISGTKALQIMWEIGDLLKKAIEVSGVAPHNLYRQIYGKAEGKENITQKSYITREFLGRSYRIRNIFKNKENIQKDLPNLKSFISFREAMPFFDNEKYILKGEEKEKLLSLLNSDLSPTSVLDKIKLLQSEKIGRKNPRNQKLDELQPQKEIFINFYNYLFYLIKNNDYESVKKEFKDVDISILKTISSNTSALAQEGVKYIEIPESTLDTQWITYLNILNSFSTQINAKERRRFRRLIPPERIVKLAEMIQALTSEDSFKNFKK